MLLLIFTTLFGVLLNAGDALQIQCYQCEEMKQNDCSTPEYIVNCTVNVQDMCQKEVLVKPDDSPWSCEVPKEQIWTLFNRHAVERNCRCDR
ncbi:hypothetical protein KUCAC02_001090 [Chaenocephalus aceratus]|uniref:Uncharacterized protein n=1 Tax=Chaenocephalus aceratus TaxID=36190 RepID=A0ACB9XWW8_CHAAC|nr:hypothetical protein KUCAC02_001090 [Chaenocephalus aceratus]